MATEIEKFFMPEGRLAQELPGFSPRREQQTVAEAIERASAARGGIALVEAGTGVGKTLAYLAPILQRASPDHKVIVSTHTLALQAQLAEKDVPLMHTVWPHPFEAGVVKGRANYLCLMEYESASGDLLTTGDAQFAEIGRWAHVTDTGDVAELPFTYSGWGDIRANGDTCKAKECRFYDRCFYYQMRRRVQDASILLVNHALFFADLALRATGGPDAKILPDYSFVVFDEAHQLESAAAGAFGTSFPSTRVPNLMDRVRRAARHLDMNFEIIDLTVDVAQAIFAPFVESGRTDFTVDDILGSPNKLQEARKDVVLLGQMLDMVATDLLKQDTGGEAAVKDRVDGLRRQCARAKADINTLFLFDNPNYVRWGSRSAGAARRGPTVTLNWTPVSVAPLLAATLWKEPRTVGAAFVSATLSTGGGFEYVRERLGLPPADSRGGDAGKITETIVGSPFDYAHNCLFYIPDHLPPPSDDPGYMRQVGEEMIALVEAARGGAFLLFTSYRALNAAYEHLTQSDLPYPILRQGEMPNARLVQTFKEEENAVLLGTQSFWEGVDVPGGALRLVVIDRIPFAVPDSPLQKARVEGITRAGGDWFREFSLPQAQLRLKQGFGRLIRTITDRGVVAVLDTRLISKAYGREFLRFLPPASRTHLRAEVAEFFADDSLSEEEHLKEHS